MARLNVLVVNAGSMSIKFHLVSEDGSAEPLDSPAAATGRAEAVAHRVVHGGPRFRAPVVIDDSVRAEIFALETIAPLHNAPALRAIEDAEAAFPDLPQVAVFDTGFHATIPDEAAVYALPRLLREEWGVHRYGFHGLSVQWSAQQVPVPRLVVCHLGGGSSVTAVLDGRSVDTTMGFSPLEGVPMATRSGSVDPGALLYLLREHALGADELDRMLNEESGLRGLAGGTGDMRELERRAGSREPDAVLALDVYVHRLVAAVAAMSAATGGLDALVFTAGIGEGSATVRRRVCERLGYLGVELDIVRNAACDGAGEVGVPGSAVRVVVVPAHEELVAARAATELLAAAGPAQLPHV
ncbi:MAG TPA: acetate/propionate family kinase [Gaiellaceae bacterium]|nr:acetate/propionate family kinase [Gaiellaceae bacterium]